MILTLHGWNLATTTLTVPTGQSVLSDNYALPHLLHSSDVPSLTEEQLNDDRVLSLPVAVTGHIPAPGESDQFVVNAVKDQQLSFRVRAMSLASMLDPVLTVHDSQDKLLKEHDDISDEQRDAELYLTLPDDGAYRVSVRDRFGHFGDRWFYVLQCEETRPSYSASLKSTSFALTHDKPLEIPVAIDRRHGFTEAIEFRVEGLPAGVTAECPRSEKDGDTSKAVVLKVTALAPETVPFQGPIRIIAESVDSKIQQPVGFETADGVLIQEAWLTAR